MRPTCPTSLRATRTAVSALAFLAAMTLAVPNACADDDDALSTDRPDFVESSNVVGKGVFQVETSLAYERDRRNGVETRTRSTPTLLRYGVSENWELRIESDGLLRQTVSAAGASSTDSGTADASLSAKWHIRDEDEASGQAALAVIAGVDFDSGSRAFRGAGKVPSVRLVAEWDLPQDASLGVMPGLFYGKDDASGQRYWGGILAATYSRPLWASTRGFVEIAGQELRSARHGGNTVTFDTGVTYAIDRDTQLDFSINVGLNDRTPDLALAIGFSRRFR
ncbi:transporter [Ramlibacter monticola]|uniref:Transporter n=1 Tax=Ramlibacter monticola TaxID=1926872 RepID=A0A936YZB6_9BURK|nr:transporter [Ramlibacter monticola]MBL0391452.1 transporter [Ramlibacter monticola]